MVHVRPFTASTGIALVSAAAIAAGPGMFVGTVPTPPTLSAAQLELTALVDTNAAATVAAGLVAGGSASSLPQDLIGVIASNVNLGGLLGGFDLGAILGNLDIDAILSGDLGAILGNLDLGAILDGINLGGVVGSVVGGVLGNMFGNAGLGNFLGGVLGGIVNNLDFGAILDGINVGEFDLGEVFGGFDFGNIAAAVTTLITGIPVIGPVASVLLTGQVAGDPTLYGSGLAGVLAYVQATMPVIASLLNLFGIAGAAAAGIAVDSLAPKAEAAAAVIQVSEAPATVEVRGVVAEDPQSAEAASAVSTASETGVMGSEIYAVDGVQPVEASDTGSETGSETAAQTSVETTAETVVEATAETVVETAPVEVTEKVELAQPAEEALDAVEPVVAVETVDVAEQVEDVEAAETTDVIQTDQAPSDARPVADRDDSAAEADSSDNTAVDNPARSRG